MPAALLPLALQAEPAPTILAPPLPPAEGLTLVEGPPGRLQEVEVRLILEAAARDADALLVSGDNRLDAYGILAAARARGLEEAVADGLVLARAFTVHQFGALVEETLPLMARGRRPGVALVTGILEPFRDEDVRPAEARTLLLRVLRSLAAWSASSNVPTVATFTPGAYADVAWSTPVPVTRVAPRAPVALTLERFAAVAEPRVAAAEAA